MFYKIPASSWKHIRDGPEFRHCGIPPRLQVQILDLKSGQAVIKDWRWEMGA